MPIGIYTKNYGTYAVLYCFILCHIPCPCTCSTSNIMYKYGDDNNA